jgi:hypothetical protein
MAVNQPDSDKKIGAAAEPCPLQKCSILVQVQRQDTKEFIGGATVKVDGPTPGSGPTTSATGTKLFDSVKPGSYKGEVTLPGKQAEEFEKPRLPAFSVAPREDKVIVVEVRSLNHWIEIVLTDEAGNPAAGGRYRLILPDQQTREGTLDANGRARIQRLESGQYKVTFPDLDPDAWEKV